MKTILKCTISALLFLFLTVAVSPAVVFADEFTPRLTAPSSEPYYTSELNIYSQTGYGMPNCVAYAYSRIYEINGEAPKFNHGSAGDWWYINKSNGYYEYGDEAKLGAVACWSNHVVVVEEISDSGEITVFESHCGGTYFDTAVYTDMSSHYGQTFYGYIYTYTEPEEEETRKNCFTVSEETEPVKVTQFNVFEVIQCETIVSPGNSGVFE
ncbi:MAG: CHAP domain-containing protein [Clostridiales bacterium]|nr:CHAP domain-containing protein [Clostridiales bacterium]